MRPLPGVTLLAPLCYQGKPDCMDARCRQMIYHDEPHVRPGCMGYHCSYCDEPCSMMGHKCSASEAILGEARRLAADTTEGTG